MSNPLPPEPQRPDGAPAPGTPPPAPPAPPEPVSGQPWSTPSGDPLSGDPLSAGPPAADAASGDQYRPQPAQPTFRPGYAALPTPPSYGPQPYATQPPYGATESTTPFAAPASATPPGYGGPYQGGPGDYPPAGYGVGPLPPGYGPPGYGAPPYGPGRRRRSNIPLIALILAVGVLLCGGAVTAGVMVVRAVTDRAKEAVKPITEPTLPQIPTEAPNLPGLPTDLPTLPTDLPTLPTDLPALPGTTGRTITVSYEVSGDGPVQIAYVNKPGEPKRIADAKLPWRGTTTMDSPAFLMVTAIREDAGSGSISCRVNVDGEEVAHSTHDGGFATVACSKWVLE